MTGPLTPAVVAAMPTLAYPTPTYALEPAENSLKEPAPFSQLLPPFYFDPSPVMIPPSICLPASECQPPADVQSPILPTHDIASHAPSPDGSFEVSVLHVTVPRCPKPKNAHTYPLTGFEKNQGLTVPVPVLSHMPVSAVKKFVRHYLSLSASRSNVASSAENIEAGSTGNPQLWHWEGARPRYLEDDQLIGQCRLTAEDCVIAFFPRASPHLNLNLDA
ncbi:hypothetical protein BDZ88DRAFT_294402 [Geranomyces variabilis]|nr:hypothetical protein BDZ88DRAFT_294402 [Geranomyces variabilis]KAJ3136521.1 hypothetical protein HDU90_003234 [Geranomyces variabilis]